MCRTWKWRKIMNFSSHFRLILQGSINGFQLTFEYRIILWWNHEQLKFSLIYYKKNKINHKTSNIIFTIHYFLIHFLINQVRFYKTNIYIHTQAHIQQFTITTNCCFSFLVPSFWTMKEGEAFMICAGKISFWWRIFMVNT